VRPGAPFPVVPAQAVSAMEGDQSVYRLDSKDHKIHRTKVRLGRERGDSVQILDGLQPGDRVLKDGHRSLADETPYELVEG
jgi:multidrug efflux pump subunit AcrA (membrane-fusion protein)